MPAGRSETVVARGHRIYTRPDLEPPAHDVTVAALRARLGADDLRRQFLPVGQDGSFAAALAGRFRTAGGIVGALRDAIDSQIDLAAELHPLAPGAGVAASRGVAPSCKGP